jgi:AP-4 complex subunit sigma-1
MLRFVLMVNKQGQTRLAQYYEKLPIDERSALEAEVIRKCLARTEAQVSQAHQNTCTCTCASTSKSTNNTHQSLVSSRNFSPQHDHKKTLDKARATSRATHTRSPRPPRTMRILRPRARAHAACARRAARRASIRHRAATHARDPLPPPPQCSFFEFRGFKVVYRRYASLFFIVGVEGEDENELSILEFIHALVETLDRYFENVCELDIMFNLEKAHFILDEMVMNGCIIEANKNNVLAPVALLDKAGSS